ncbi:antibiotic biosynthesis monooxygenase family protein [Methylobrevis pamukkalensis]|uniref:Heme oxygenase (Staphylobilin-producing) 2 n=1 Tax=Methylobrevis pamukkalensis TaxID=1439726 RepID=A0A1E3H442_9HYPH|nr:antibiotic biosynthesis monooxygenase [Methylobrevis pamukkalensis]ODN71088.1 Heme oxygenase (staphylobilin-producing) 2 [Methylobrevis pamukkalensis]
MYIAMNRFRIIPGHEETFEAIWATRQGRLKDVPGYVEFHLLRGPEAEDHTLYATHTIWESHDHFVAWTRSEAFRLAHANAGGPKDKIYLAGPHFEGFQVVISEDRDGVRRDLAA